MGGQADKILHNFEPEPQFARRIIANDWAGESPMFEFELIGLALVILFFGALGTGNPNVAGR
jgi:hypothetical protein